MRKTQIYKLLWTLATLHLLKYQTIIIYPANTRTYAFWNITPQETVAVYFSGYQQTISKIFDIIIFFFFSSVTLGQLYPWFTSRIFNSPINDIVKISIQKFTYRNFLQLGSQNDFSISVFNSAEQNLYSVSFDNL